MTTKALLHRKARRASRSATVWFSAAVPVLLAAAEALKEQLPAMGALLSGWRLVAASVLVSAVVTALRVRSTRAEPAEPAEPFPALDAPERAAAAAGSNEPTPVPSGDYPALSALAACSGFDAGGGCSDSGGSCSGGGGD